MKSTMLFKVLEQFLQAVEESLNQSNDGLIEIYVSYETAVQFVVGLIKKNLTLINSMNEKLLIENIDYQKNQKKQDSNNNNI